MEAKRGRPKKVERRTKKVVVNFTPKEFEQIEQFGNNINQSYSNIFRELWLTNQHSFANYYRDKR